MWLKRLHKQSNYGSSPSGGAGSDLGVGSDNVMGLHGQGVFFSGDGDTREQTFKKKKKRKWRSLKDRQQK